MNIYIYTTVADYAITIPIASFCYTGFMLSSGVGLIGIYVVPSHLMCSHLWPFVTSEAPSLQVGISGWYSATTSLIITIFAFGTFTFSLTHFLPRTENTNKASLTWKMNHQDLFHKDVFYFRLLTSYWVRCSSSHGNKLSLDYHSDDGVYIYIFGQLFKPRGQSVTHIFASWPRTNKWWQ